MDYTLTLEKAGRREWLLGFLRGNLDSFDTAVFDFKEIRQEGDVVYLDFEIDIDRLVYQVIIRALNVDGDNPLTKQGVTIQLGQRIKERIQAKRTAKKKAVSKRATKKKK